jgi:hypothetical protein
MKRTIDAVHLNTPLLPTERASDVKPGKTAARVRAVKKAAMGIQKQVAGFVAQVAGHKSAVSEVIASEPKTVRFDSEPQLQAPLNFKHLLSDLKREAGQIEALPVQGDRIVALEALWVGLGRRLLSALAPGISDETGRRRALAVILLANHHASFEKFARKGDAAAFADHLGVLREAMDTSSPDSFWRCAELGPVLQGLLRVSMHAGAEDDITRRALEMLDALCGEGRVSSALRKAMKGLVTAAQDAHFALDRVWEQSPQHVENVIDALLKLGPPLDPLPEPGALPKG